MNELKAMSTQQIRDYINVTEIALKQAAATSNKNLERIARRDIDEAIAELASRA